MEPIGFPETTTRCVIAQKKAILVHFAAKSCNLAVLDRPTNCCGIV